MKTPVAALVLTAAALCAGSTLAQTRPQAPGPRAAVPAPPPPGQPQAFPPFRFGLRNAFTRVFDDARAGGNQHPRPHPTAVN
jgi:hypothetical protein